LRLRPLRRLPMTLGWMSKRPVPAEVMDRWFRPVQTSREIRRDLRKYSLSIPPKKVLLGWHEGLRSFDRPALVVWASEDRVMPPEHGRRLAGPSFERRPGASRNPGRVPELRGGYMSHKGATERL
jgi:hypothetical protein